MSASTLSVTANPSAATRRRPSAISADVRHGIGIVNDTVVSPNVDNTGDDKAVSNKDLSHSIRGEAVLERSSKDTLPPKKSQLPSSNAALRTRNRKTGPQPKPAKSRWQTILSVLGKNFFLLLVLVGLVQMVRRLVINTGSGVGLGSLAGFSDMEGRIAGVESSLKTTAKMLQVQVEVVDKKIDSLVGDLKKDVSRKIEEKSVEIDTQLRKLDERSESLEAGLEELKSKDLLTRDDLKRLYDELLKRKGGGNTELSLGEIRVLARDIVEKEIEKHAADGLGKVDYALASGGAMIVKHSEPLSGGKLGNWFSGANRQGVHSEAEKMLKPSFGEPGQCFPLKGGSGFVQIRLRKAIVPEAITLEHVAKSVAYDQSSAPKHCQVSGWLQGSKGLETELTTDNQVKHLLTEFTYDLEKSNAQTFDVLDSARSTVIDTVRFDFSSNYGCVTHTCIYRLRVHGHEPNSVPMIGSDSYGHEPNSVPMIGSDS